jgi:hypothetical protein
MLVFLCKLQYRYIMLWSLLLNRQQMHWYVIQVVQISPGILFQVYKSNKHRISHPPTTEVLVQVDKTMLWITWSLLKTNGALWVNIQIEGWSNRKYQSGCEIVILSCTFPMCYLTLPTTGRTGPYCQLLIMPSTSWVCTDLYRAACTREILGLVKMNPELYGSSTGD